jgi:hypothetical protein
VTFAKQQHAIRSLKSRSAVRNRNHCRSMHQVFNLFLNGRFGITVERGSGLV